MDKLVKGTKLKPLIPLFDQAFESWLFNVEGTYVYLNTFFKKRTATQ